ncbi:MAG: serine/threonine protein kinase [Deltaproteobacteria bacterium]|nr:serine/threonine protein kinase [Deltaproteobacteria bacterium]
MTSGADERLLGGRYRLGRRLAAGGRAEVFLARQLALRREVVVKTARGPGAADELAREAQALARVAHESVVAVHEVGADRGRAFLVLERVRGRTVRALARERAWTPAAVAELLGAITRALAQVHREGWAHGDVRAENVVVVTRSGAADAGAAALAVKLIDFGEAQPLSATEPLPRVWGKAPGGLAPERRRGGVASVAADLYAVGVIGWELLHGRTFPGGAAPPPGWAPDGAVGAAVQAVVMGLCADDPARRPARAELAAQALDGSSSPRARLAPEPARQGATRVTRPRPLRAIPRDEHVGPPPRAQGARRPVST